MKPLDLATVEKLLDGSTSRSTGSDFSKGFMLMADGTKEPFDSTRCGVFVGRAGSPRKLVPPDKEVLAYVSRIHY